MPRQHSATLCIFAAGLIGVPTIAAACAKCVFGFAEAAFPPTVMWSLVTVPWFLAAMALLPVEKLGFFGRSIQIGGSGAITVVAVLCAISMCGPFPLIPLFLMAAWRNGQAAFSNSEDAMAVRGRARVLGTIALIVIAATGVVSFVQAARRDDVAYILRWSGTGPSGQRLDALAKKRDLPSLRRLVQSRDDYEGAVAARKLSEIGNPAIDGPIMAGALAQLEKQDPHDWGGDWAIGEYQGALKKLLGKDPVTGKKAKDWEALLQAPNGS